MPEKLGNATPDNVVANQESTEVIRTHVKLLMATDDVKFGELSDDEQNLMKTKILKLLEPTNLTNVST